MKKLLLSAIIAISVLPAMADLDGNGYYRVQNAKTKRYAYLLDDKGSMDAQTSTVDVRALELYLGFKRASSDPSTIFYINKTSGSKYEYDIAGQGTSLYGFLHKYMYVLPGKVLDGTQSYYAYGKDSGMTKYIGDLNSDLTDEVGLASADVNGDRRLWYIDPVNADSSDNYFGVAPTLSYNGKYLCPMYAGFPYDAYSTGIRFYMISRINPWAAEPAVELKEVKGVIPSGSPVIIECSRENPSDNRLNVGPSGNQADLRGNMLKGVYFENYGKIHRNLTPYDKRTMRLLMVKDGELVFSVADIDYLPRNQAYLQLTDASQYGVQTFKVVSEEEYETYYAGVESIEADGLVDVYSLDGRLIRSAVEREEVNSLPKGMYILRSGGKSEKMMVR